MLSHIASDLHQAYLEEVFKPQLGKPGASTPAKPTSSADLDGDGNVDSFEKKVRQFIYDVRHLMRKQNIPVERAFQIRSSKTNYGAEVIKTAKEKLGIKAGGTTPVSEEVGKEKLYSIVINYKNGTTYRKRTSRSEINKLRSNPNVSSVEMTKYGVDGLAKKDYDGDGKIESPSKEHAGAVHNAIQRKKGGVPDGQDTRGKTSKKKLKGYGVSEGFSNWRQDLKEVMGVDDEIASRKQKQIKEKKVDNYGGGKNSVVKINPDITEKVEILGGHIVESFELNEDYLNEAVNIATEFFYNCGLNENGVEIVIEELGKEAFSEFVFDFCEEYLLSEELKKSESKVKTSKAPKGTKQYATTIARIKKQGGTAMSSKDRVASTIRKDRVKKAVDNAKETQAPSSNTGKKPVRDAIARGIFGIAKAYQKGMERHRAATQTAGKALTVARKGAEKFAGGVRSGVEATVDAAKKTKKAVVGEEYIEEKAESEQQQKLFGLALSVKRGETPRDKASAEVLKIVDTMSEKKIRDFAKTKHSGIPKKVEEAIANPEGVNDPESPTITKLQKKIANKQVENAQRRIGEDLEPKTPKQISAQNQLIRSQRMLSAADQQALQQKKKEQQNKREPQTQNASYTPEGKVIGETKLGYALERLSQRRRTSGDIEGASRAKRMANIQFSSASDPATHSKATRKMRQQQAKQSTRQPEDSPNENPASWPRPHA